jgi:hypothetical protein
LICLILCQLIGRWEHLTGKPDPLRVTKAEWRSFGLRNPCSRSYRSSPTLLFPSATVGLPIMPRGSKFWGLGSGQIRAARICRGR